MHRRRLSMSAVWKAIAIEVLWICWYIGLMLAVVLTDGVSWVVAVAVCVHLGMLLGRHADNLEFMLRTRQLNDADMERFVGHWTAMGEVIRARSFDQVRQRKGKQ